MTRMYESTNHLCIRTGYADPVLHRHMAAHIILSMGGELTVLTEGKNILCQGILIPSGISHQVDTGSSPALVFLYDCTGSVAKEIRQVRYIAKEDCHQILQKYAGFEQHITPDTYRDFQEFLCRRLGLSPNSPTITDERITAAMDYIRTRLCDALTCQEVADHVCLSQSRFSHLFHQQAGMTFAAYLIYQRLVYGYTRLLRGNSITEAALEAGFSSSAHFADVNRRVFGISAGSLTRDLIFVKV